MNAHRQPAPERVLACGRPASWLVTLATEQERAELAGTDARHLAACPHCRAELDDQRRRWSAVRTATTVPVRVPPELVGTVLASVNALRHGSAGQRLEIPATQGVTRVSEPALLLLARRLVRDAAAAVPDCRVRSVSGHVDRLQVRVAVRYGHALDDIAAGLRDECDRQLHRTFGSAAPPLDVLVDDLLPPPPGA